MAKIGFILWRLNTQNNKETGVWGEEIICNALVKSLNKLGHTAKTYRPDTVEPLDVAVYTCYDMPVIPEVAKKNYLWIQGFNYGIDGNIFPLDTLYDLVKDRYDKVFTASTVLAKMRNISFLPPCVDFDYYHPVKFDPCYAHDISFIGNMIKPTEVNQKYLGMLSGYNYGLYGGDYGKIDHETALKVICSSNINLHYGFEEGIKWDMVTGRPLFHSACKAFTLSDKLPYFETVFGEAMGFLRDVDYWLKIPILLMDCANRAYYIAKEKFSNEIIVKELLNIL